MKTTVESKKKPKKKAERSLTFLNPKPNNVTIVKMFEQLPQNDTSGGDQLSEKQISKINQANNPEYKPNFESNRNNDVINMSTFNQEERRLLIKAADLNNIEMLPYFKKHGEKFNNAFKNLSEAHKNIFYVRKNVIQDPLHKIEKKLLDIYLELFWLHRSSFKIATYFNQNKQFIIDQEIYEKLICLSERGLQEAQDLKQLIENVQDISLMVETRKKYNSYKHADGNFNPTIYLSEKPVLNSNGKEYKTSSSLGEETEGSDDEPNNGEQQKEICSRCKEETYGDIRYLRISCCYNLEELQIKDLKFDKEHQKYVLPICKDCRHDFMFNCLHSWFYQHPGNNSYQQNMTINSKDKMQIFIKEFSEF
jgi:hypothetical protein